MAAISNERVRELDEKIRQMQEYRQQLLAKVKEEERRKRTRRLIEIGATMDSIRIDTLEKANAFKEGLKANPEIKIWLDALLSQFVKSNEKDA